MRENAEDYNGAIVHATTLQWRLNGCDSVSNHQPHDCLLNHLFRRRSKKISKALRHWPLCGEFTGGRWIPRKNGQLRGKCFHLIIWWRHHELSTRYTVCRALLGFAASKSTHILQGYFIHDCPPPPPLPAPFEPVKNIDEPTKSQCHYSDVMMSAMASEITGVSIVCSTVCSGTD